MLKIDWKNEKHKKTFIIIGYCLFILIVGITMIVTNTTMYSYDAECFVQTEISKINTTQIGEEDAIGNYRVEVIDYNQLSYYIKVNCKEQIVTINAADENGEYTIPIKTMICSTGIATPNQGVFEISDKYEWRFLVGDVYGQYASRITGKILFHSVPYTKQDKSSLEYWEYDKLGQPVSKGCVRLTVEDAKWIYDYCKPGTKVEFCEEDIGQLENYSKDLSVKKISGYSEELRNWDPTDPDENNPWLEYNEASEY